MKRPTAKQIAARKLFAKRARAGEFARKRRKKNPGVRIVHNKLLGGWYVVTGPHQSPLNGRFNSKLEAEAWLRNRKTNPRKRFVTNRWGITISVGDSFKVKHPGGDTDGPFTVKKLETSGKYAKAYGARVIFDHGGSASIDDLIVTPHSYRKENPKRRKKNPDKKCTLIFSVKSPYTGKWTVHTRKEVDESRYSTGHYERVKADLLAYARKYAANNEGYAVKVVETKSK